MSLDHSPFRVSTESFNKVIQVPGSKSYANRVLILAALCPDKVIINNIPLSSDVEKMISCLTQI